MGTIKRRYSLYNLLDTVIERQAKRQAMTGDFQQGNSEQGNLVDPVTAESCLDNFQRLSVKLEHESDTKTLGLHLQPETSTEHQCSARNQSMMQANATDAWPKAARKSNRGPKLSERINTIASEATAEELEASSAQITELRKLSLQSQHLERQRDAYMSRAKLAEERRTRGEEALGQLLRTLIAVQRGIEIKRRQIAYERTQSEEHSRLARQLTEQIQERRRQCDVILETVCVESGRRQ